MKLSKRLMALVLSLCIVSSLLVPAVSAADSDITDEGVSMTYDFIGRNLTYLNLNKGESADTITTRLTGMNSRFTKGTVNWTYAADTISNTTANSFRTYTEGTNRNSHLHARTAKDEWVAMILRSPGAGTYIMSLEHNIGRYGALEAEVYVLPSSAATFVTTFQEANNVASVTAALGSSSKVTVGTVNFEQLENTSNETTNGAVDPVTSTIGEVTLRNEETFVIVFKVTDVGVGSGYMWFRSLTLTEGSLDDSDSAESVPGSIGYSFNSIGKSATALAESLETTYAADANSYALAAGTTDDSIVWTSKSLKFGNSTSGSLWAAFVLNVAESGYYNLHASLGVYKGDHSGYEAVDIYLLDDSNKDAIDNLNGQKNTTGLFDSMEKIMGGTVDGSLHHYISGTNVGVSYAYLGNQYLEQGEYILLVDPRTADNTVEHTFFLRSVTLVPGEDGSAFVDKVNNAAGSETDPITTQVEVVYQLGADLKASEATLTLGAQDLALNGNKLEVAAITSPFLPGAATQLETNVTSGITGDGTVVVTSGAAPMLPYGSRQAISLKAGENAWYFCTPTIVSGEPFTGQPFMHDPSNVGFAFQISMSEAAKEIIAKGNSGLELTLDWTIGELQGRTVKFSEDDLVKWAKGEGDTFYVEVANLESLIEEYGAVNCVPSISKDFVSYSGVDIDYYGKKPEWDADGVLKILFIGNSFSNDTVEYACQIANNLGIENVVIGNLYIGGCSLEKHLDKFTDKAADYTYYYYVNGDLTYTKGFVGNDALTDENWDYVSFQQKSGYSYNASTYSYLDDLMDIVEEACPQATFVWNMTWAYDNRYLESEESGMDMTDVEMYTGIVGAVQSEILTNDRIAMVMPVGTAIQNARTSFMGSDDYENSTGYNLTKDGRHLSTNTGRYIAAATFMGQLMNLDLSQLTWKPDSVSEEEALVAIESAINALENPYEVTNSIYTTQG